MTDNASAQPTDDGQVDARSTGESYLQALGNLFQGSQSSSRDATPDQVLTLSMGNMQALGLMAVYYELRHGHDVQAAQTVALNRLLDQLRRG